jgi:hypothetical protein
MRCNDCNKFVGVDDSNEPEVTIEVDSEDGSIEGSADVYAVSEVEGFEPQTFEVSLSGYVQASSMDEA